MSMKRHLLIAVVSALILSACDPALEDKASKTVIAPPAIENPQNSSSEKTSLPDDVDEKTFTRHKKTIKFFLDSAGYLALVKVTDIERKSIGADEIGQMQGLNVKADVLETFRGNPANTITYEWAIEMDPLEGAPEIDTAPQIISLCDVGGDYIAQEVGFSIEAYPALTEYAREQGKANPNNGHVYSSCPSDN